MLVMNYGSNGLYGNAMAQIVEDGFFITDIQVQSQGNLYGACSNSTHLSPNTFVSPVKSLIHPHSTFISFNI
jgi:hypothetical protein